MFLLFLCVFIMFHFFQVQTTSTRKRIKDEDRERAMTNFEEFRAEPADFSGDDDPVPVAKRPASCQEAGDRPEGKDTGKGDEIAKGKGKGKGPGSKGDELTRLKATSMKLVKMSMAASTCLAKCRLQANKKYTVAQVQDMHTYIHTYIYTHTYTYIRTYIHTCTHTHIHTHHITTTYTHTCTYISTYIHTHTHIHTYIHIT
jgi:hypothetical protein